MISQGLPRAKPKHVDFRFSMTPEEVARRPDLSQGAKNLFGLIMAFCRLRAGACWLTNEDMAGRTGLCLEQVRRLLRRLEELGLIEREMIGPRRREIRVAWVRPDKMYPHGCTGNKLPDQGIHIARIDGRQGIHFASPDEIEGEKKEMRLFAPLPEGGGPEEPPAKFDWRRMAAELKD